jgi:hypothetical protein
MGSLGLQIQPRLRSVDVLHEYEGYHPSNVGKYAKYTMKIDDGVFKPHLLMIEGGELYYLPNAQHDALVVMVNKVKLALSGKEGGQFYINEYHHVLVPHGGGNDRTVYFAGQYSDSLTFQYKGRVISPSALPGMAPGDPWTGSRVGIKYSISAKGDDLFYRKRTTDTHRHRVESKMLLSNAVGPDVAKRLANRLYTFKGSAGIVYLNEACEFFAPPSSLGGEFTYLGHLDPDDWFPEPLTPVTPS